MKEHYSINQNQSSSDESVIESTENDSLLTSRNNLKFTSNHYTSRYVHF